MCGEDITLAILEIILPIDFPIEEGIVEYEKISKQKIPPKFIRFLRKEYSSKGAYRLLF